MAYRLRINILLVSVCCLLSGFLLGQDNDNSESITTETSTIDWDEITDGQTFLEVSEPVKDVEPLQMKEVDLSPSFYDLSWFRTFAIILLIAIMIVVLYFIVANKNSNLKVKNELEYSIAEAEMNIDKSDLNYLLQQALDHKEYKLALRIYYLIIIKELNTKGLIKYKKDKTNYTYLLEMQPNKNYGSFKNLTRIYEYFWYGDKELTASKFEPITQVMQSFVTQIKEEGEAI